MYAVGGKGPPTQQGDSWGKEGLGEISCNLFIVKKRLEGGLVSQEQKGKTLGREYWKYLNEEGWRAGEKNKKWIRIWDSD